MTEHDLADTLTQSIEAMVDRTVHLTESSRLDDACSIINEWTLGEECILTKYLNGDTESIDDELIYVSSTDDDVIYGSFRFNLPVDNN